MVVDGIIVYVVYGSVALANVCVRISPKFCPDILVKFYQCSSLQTSKNCERDL